MNREEALELLKEYNKEPFHIEHGITVGNVMRWYAQKLGYGDEADFWEVVGILHDLDFEQWPDQHCVKVQELMAERGLDPRLIRAVACHGYGVCGEDLPEPEHTGEAGDILRREQERAGEAPDDEVIDLEPTLF